MLEYRKYGLKIKGSSYLAEYTSKLASTLVQKRAMAALVAARVDAESANKTKSQFLANMSHELRTPLNAIIGFSEMLSNPDFGEKLDETSQEYSEYILQSAQHLLDLINDVLNMSKVESGLMEINGSSTTFEDILERCLVFVKEKANLKNIPIVVNSELNSVGVFVDETKLKQVFLNILTNAIKFTPDGGSIAVTLSYTASGNVRCIFRDTGIGMTVDQIEVALTPFGQVSNRDYDHNDGTGLGLPLAKSFVELHGATFRIKSEPGLGTEIAMDFPRDLIVKTNRADAADTLQC